MFLIFNNGAYDHSADFTVLLYPNNQAKLLNNYLDSEIRYLFLQETKIN